MTHEKAQHTHWEAQEFVSPKGTWYIVDGDGALLIGAGKPIGEDVAKLAASAPELKAQVAELTAQRDALLEACKWVMNDAAYKAPEQFVEASEIWLDRLRRAIAQATDQGDGPDASTPAGTFQKARRTQ